MSTQNNSQQTNTPPADVKSNSEAGLEDSLNPIFKAIADLQDAVKDLASAVTSSADVNDGLKETMATKSDLEAIKKELLDEVKKFAVGAREAATASKEGDKMGKLAGTPTKAESAQEEVQAPSASLRENGAEMLDKKKGVITVETPRPTMEVGGRLKDGSQESEDLIKEVLKGNVKPIIAGKKAYDLQYMGVG